jgi:hypothetical protein
MYIGRGDFPPTELHDHYDYVQQTFSDPDWAISQMMEKTPLADYLADGLAKLGKFNMNVDNLLATQA